MQRGRGACWSCFAIQQWIVREGEDEQGGLEIRGEKMEIYLVKE